MDGFMRGVNLGGWLSQYRECGRAHFAAFITRRDAEAIAAAGYDHLRLPVDYPLLLDEDGGARDEGFTYLDACMEWAASLGMGVVLDLHAAPGFRFQDHDKATLFTDASMQERFLDIWRRIATRYSGSSTPLVFELLNEIVLPDSGPWNRLAARAIGTIRAAGAGQGILIGGNRWNSPRCLDELDLFDDPGVIYSFHFYEPHSFTHQKAPWVGAYRLIEREIGFPGDSSPIDELIAREGRSVFEGSDLSRYAGRRFDLRYLREELEPALRFRDRTGREVYCGEYGAFEGISLPSRVAWTAAVSALLEGEGIGRAYWTWKEMDFGLVDSMGRERFPGLIGASLGG